MTLHWPSVRGRARADAGLLTLVAVVVAIISMLAGATPALMRATTDVAIRDAVRDAGDDAQVIAHADWEYDDVLGGRSRAPKLADDVDAFRERADSSLDPDLSGVLNPAIATASGPSLDITDGSLLRTFQFTYLADERGPFSASRVTWVAGGPPQATAGEAVVPRSGPPWPVQVGLSEADAAALKMKPGDRIPLKDQFLRVKIVTISGVFRATDPADPAWRLAPWLLRPSPGLDGVGTTRLGGLLSPESLPDARLAVEQEEMDRAVYFEPDPAALLLTGVLTGTVLVLLLAAALLARRRAPALIGARQRGAGLPGLAAELLIESVAVALVSAAAGLAAARVVTPGIAWWWAVPVVAAAALAGPAYGVVVAARATRDRRVPANRTARRRIRRTALIRRAALEGAVLVAAALAVIALRQRGILPASAGPTSGALDPFTGQEGTSALAASAPSLGVIAGALVLLRLLPPVLRLVLRRALRSNRPLAVFGTAQAAAGASRTLPVLVMTAAAALATFALSFGATADRGLEDASWRTVGADARADTVPAAGVDLVALAGKVAAAPGVEHVATGQITEGARVANESKLVTVRLIVLDAAAYRRVLADTPLPDAPALGDLTAGGAGGVPALVRSADGSLRPGMRLQFPRKEATPIALTAVAPAPVLGDSGDAMYVDAAALTAAGVPVEPNTLWVSGPGAARALDGIEGIGVTVRAELARDRRAAPVNAGLFALTWVSAIVLGALGLLGFALGAAAGAPQRWATMGRLRTLGLRLRDTRTVAAGELLPPVLVAAVGGPLLGLLLAHLTTGSLALRLLVGWDSDPPLTVPWWTLLALAVVFLAAVPVAGAAETSVRRRQGLGELLRVGGT
jgi:putative ABC transport system permease protein